MSNELYLKNMENIIAQTLKNHPENETMIKIFSPLILCEERFLLENPLKRISGKSDKFDDQREDQLEDDLLINKKNISLDVKKIAILKEQLCIILKEVLPQLTEQIEYLEKNLSNAKLKSMCQSLLLHEKNRTDIIKDYLDTILFPLLAKKKSHLINNKEAFFSLLELLLSRIEHTFLNRYARAINAQQKAKKGKKTKDNTQNQPKVADISLKTFPQTTIERPTCPYCGSRPSLSIIHTKEGKRDLLCPNCGQTWRFKRTICPNCLTEEAKNLLSIYKNTAVKTTTKDGIIEEKDKNLGGSSSGISERAIYCEKCHHYLLELDLREKSSPFEHIAILSLGLAYLDAIMQDRNGISFF